MPRKNFVNVDELIPQVSLEQVAAYYGVPLPELHRTGQEIRSQCFLNCSKTEETGDRALAIKGDHPARQWRCHQYGCGKGGNLVSLCDLLKPGENMEGRPRGDRFKAIAADLQALVNGEQGDTQETVVATSQPTPSEAPAERKSNVPLKDSDNERARGLVNLDEKFLTIPDGNMNKHAASYFRERLFLTPDVCRKWRMGYLPRDAGGDRSGGTMRGSIVYPLLSENGDVLTWFGRDPEFEGKHSKWQQKGRSGKEPEKCHFVKGFQRGLELFGQSEARLEELGYRETISELGIVVVEGPNDVIALDCLKVPAWGLCSNTISIDQVAKIVSLADQWSDGKVTLMLDNDPAGENGMKQALYALAQECKVQLAWSPNMHNGKFRGRQPESLQEDERNDIFTAL